MAFVPVKRLHDEDPFHSIIMSHKKLKTVGIHWSRDSIFQFEATIIDKNENLARVFKKAHGREEKSVKCLTKTNKNINDVIAHAKAERLKFVNTFRVVNQDVVLNEEEDGKNSEIKVVDFVKQAEDSQDNDKTLIDEGISIDYVYGLYYTLNSEDKSIDVQDIDSTHIPDFDKFYNIHRSIIESDSDSSLREDEGNYNNERYWINDSNSDGIENSDNEDELVDMMNRLTLKRNNIRNFENDENTDNESTIGDYDIQFSR